MRFTRGGLLVLAFGVGLAVAWSCGAGDVGSSHDSGPVGDGRTLLGTRCDGVNQCPGSLICVLAPSVGGQCSSHCNTSEECTRNFRGIVASSLCIGDKRPEYCVRGCTTSRDCLAGTTCDTAQGWCRAVAR